MPKTGWIATFSRYDGIGGELLVMLKGGQLSKLNIAHKYDLGAKGLPLTIASGDIEGSHTLRISSLTQLRKEGTCEIIKVSLEIVEIRESMPCCP
jgi:hypothetical protein